MKEKHIEAFVQEASELLIVLEESLIDLETKPGDNELIDKIFRSLHTIKGSAGMFGFDDISAFVHDIETVYDKVRNKELDVDKSLIDLTLNARDQISFMLKNENKQNSIENEIVKQILSSFKGYLDYSEIIEKKEEIIRTDENKKEDVKIIYHIYFEPSENLLLSGTNPVGLISEISSLGKAIISPITEKIPPLDLFDPEKLYTSWNIVLSTNRGINEIKDVFIFVEDDCKINISEIGKGELKEDYKYYSEIINKSNKNAPDVGSKEKIIHHEKSIEQKIEKKELKNDNSGSQNISSIRVNSDKLDLLVNLVGELVTVQARLSQTAAHKNDSLMISIAEDVERLTWELRDNALSIRMIPIETTFNKFKRLIRDLSKELGKEVELITEGGETELDKNVIEKLNDPLVHIIRNSIGHGIENPEERLKKGKERSGKVLLSAVHSGTHVLIQIKDDGAGLNKEAIYEKAIERGIITKDTNLTDKEIFNLIFQPGFSTAKVITNVSGRGVGMDVVQSAIESLRGSIEVESITDKGTTITLKLPLTLAIIEGLIVKIDKDFFVIPLSFVEECIELTPEIKKKSNGRNLIGVRGEIVPYIPLREKFNINSNLPPIEQIVLINESHSKTGLVVDEIIGERQVVIKSLGTYYKNIEMMSGATVLGDGTVALIMDIKKVIEKAELDEKIYSGK